MQSIRENPFLGLKPYELKDRKKLYGRDKDLVLMKDRIFSARTTLLFAGSGVGKTSFLNAKIRPEFQGQYSVIYHNRWTGTDEPLVALKKTLAEQLPPDLRPPHGPSSGGDGTLLHYLRGFKKASEESGEQTTRCLLILDQFEEIFQYHAYEKYFGHFVQELSDLINNTNCNTRVLFSMREEFLGELSVFDNHIPDLFNNYYRLKCPNKLETEEIIQRTCAVDSLTVDEAKLKDLVDDLAKVEKGEAGIVERAKESRQVVERHFIAPPYLQIACQRLWDAQFSDHRDEETQPFLSKYETGDARKMLNLFCQEKLSSLSDKERAILVEAFDFLVTKKGAKMAYELTSLAEHMAVNENLLKSVLLKLSSPESRILRASSGPDGSLWFELYHDMYGSIVDEWKRTYRLNRKARVRGALNRAALGMGLVFMIFGGYLSIHHWYVEPRRYRALLREADLQNAAKYKEYESGFTKLRDTLGFGNQAKELWAAAWRRRAHFAESQEKGTEALLCWLSATVYSSSQRGTDGRLQIANYLNNTDYRSLVATYGSDLGTTSPTQNPPLFSVDGRTLFTFTKDLRVLQWEAQTGKLKTPPSLSLQLGERQESDPASAERTPKVGKPPSNATSARDREGTEHRLSQDQSQGPFLRAAAGNLVAGFTRASTTKPDGKEERGTKTSQLRFLIWRIDNGTVVWFAFRGEGKGSVEPAASFAPDGRHFATLDETGLAQIYTVSQDQTEVSQKPINIWRSVTNLIFNPDNQTVLLRLSNQTLRLWDLSTNKLRVEKKLQLSSPRVGFSPDGTRLLLRTPSGDAEILDTATLSTVHSLPRSYYPESSQLMSDNTTVVWYRAVSVERGKQIYLTFLNSETGGRATRVLGLDDVTTVIFNPDGKSVLTVSEDSNARLWNLSPGESVGKLIQDRAIFVKITLSDDGRTIATENKNKEIKIWNADNAQQIGAPLVPVVQTSETTFPRSPNYLYQFEVLSLSPNGQYICFKNAANAITVWEVATRREIPLIHPKNVVFGILFFSPDSEILVSTSSDNITRLWRGLRQTPVAMSWPQGSENFRQLVFSPDSRYLASIYLKGQSPREMGIKVVDVSTLIEIPMVDYDPKMGLTAVVLSAGGKMMTRGKDKVAFVWDLANGHLLYKLDTSAPIISSAFSPDGKLAITACYDGSVQLWDMNNGQKIGSFQKYDKRIVSVGFSPDNKKAICVSEQWIHLSSVSDKGLQYETSRLISNRFSYRPRILSQIASDFRLLSSLSDDTIRIEELHFDSLPDSQTPALDAENLLREWQNKLALRFDDNGQIVARRDSNLDF